MKVVVKVTGGIEVQEHNSITTKTSSRHSMITITMIDARRGIDALPAEVRVAHQQIEVFEHQVIFIADQSYPLPQNNAPFASLCTVPSTSLPPMHRCAKRVALIVAEQSMSGRTTSTQGAWLDMLMRLVLHSLLDSMELTALGGDQGRR